MKFAVGDKLYWQGKLASPYPFTNGEQIEYEVIECSKIGSYDVCKARSSESSDRVATFINGD